MSNNLAGGKGIAVLYPISSDHATVTTTAALTLDETVKSDIQADNFSFDNLKADSQMFTFLNTYAYAQSAGGSEPEKLTLEGGASRQTSAASGAQQFLCIIYGEENADGVAVTHGIGTISADSGAFSQENQKFVRPSFKLNLTQAKADVTLATALYDADIVDVTAAGTFPEGNTKYVSFEDAA